LPNWEFKGGLRRLRLATGGVVTSARATGQASNNDIQDPGKIENIVGQREKTGPFFSIPRTKAIKSL